MLTPSTEETIHAMEIYGGSFVQALAEAYRRADHINFAKLRKAFPEYWEEYQIFAANLKLKNNDHVPTNDLSDNE